MQIKTRFNSQGQTLVDFEPVGRNEASTFLGLCSHHDNSLFEPIDKHAIDISNDEQLFLLSYRSVLKEYYAVLTGYLKIQKSYLEKVEAGLIPGEDLVKDMIPIEFGVNAYETHNYKATYDEALKTRNFKAIRHRTLIFDNQLPSIACSQLFSADSINFKDDVLRIVFNVLPVEIDKTLVIFSTTDEEFNLAESYIQRCFEGDEFFKKYEVSKQVLRNCENFFINPSFFDKWTSEKKKKIVDFYIDTLNNDHDDNAIEYYLFENGA